MSQLKNVLTKLTKAQDGDAEPQPETLVSKPPPKPEISSASPSAELTSGAKAPLEKASLSMTGEIFLHMSRIVEGELLRVKRMYRKVLMESLFASSTRCTVRLSSVLHH
ncbi:hypothetical protein LB505_002920 [Fusarium chuoi]|nr:hypothetical protein LB505_002920 [Fusarium chuoi]